MKNRLHLHALRSCHNQVFFEDVFIVVEELFGSCLVSVLCGIGVLVGLAEHGALDDDIVAGVAELDEAVDPDKLLYGLHVTSKHLDHEVGSEVCSVVLFVVGMLLVVKDF